MTSDAATTTEEHPLIGETLRGTYHVLRTLDQGGMGLVFEAEHARLRRRVAVKVLARHLASDTQALARFNREAEIISQLEHPHIVQILDFDTTAQGEPYIVMELLKGESLSARLERDGCLRIAEAVRITHQVASGLFVAHNASIVHRDLKPANIFLCEMVGQAPLIKLLDFGISKRVGVGRSLTGEFDVLGTPDYMAPEQALGKTASVDHRGDQYALAVIAFEMLSGQTPFSGTDVMDVLQKVTMTEAPSIERFAPHVPSQVSAVLKRALEKEPDARYGTVLEFAVALSQACELSLPPPVDALGIAQTLPASGMGRTARSLAPSLHPGERYQTGPRRAAARFGTASTLSGSATLKDIPRALEQAREAHGLGDANLAVSYAESALRLAEGFDTPDAQKLIDSEAVLIDHIFESRLGSLEHRLTVPSAPSQVNARVSPEQAFLLSRVDGGVTVEEALDLSPLSRRETLRLLVGMLQLGLINVIAVTPSSGTGSNSSHSA
ncbi:MAG TPA: serine/threonine-protein kinase [Polyangiaceae bacterium]|jgi:serine/threonine-protein kinase|nr:serine/threonine-protein kinase [Polyangiaceae bacterium]